MSDNIVPFPASEIREWTSVERQLKKLMESAPLSDVARKRILSRLKTFYETLTIKLDFTFDATIPTPITFAQQQAIKRGIDTLAQRCADQFQVFNCGLLIERLKREIESELDEFS